MRHFNTVLGRVSEEDLGVTLCHEHICCYSEYLYTMAGEAYLDKAALEEAAVGYLRKMKADYGLRTFIDCTPVNIGRDVELLRRVSERAEVNIIGAAGFYYSEEPLTACLSAERIAEYLVTDGRKINAGVLKCAVEHPQMRAYDEKILKAMALAQRELGIPLIMHTNGRNQNGSWALELLLAEGVAPESITVGHLSDAEDLDYVKSIAAKGSFLGFDRLYGSKEETYVARTTEKILELCRAGYAEQILLSHDALFFNGFEKEPALHEKPRFAYVFDCILPRLPKEIADGCMKANPCRMLACGKEKEK